MDHDVLNHAEEQIRDAFPTGRNVRLPVGGPDQHVRAEVLSRILTGDIPSPDERDSRPALRLSGATIIGKLDLSEATINAGVLLAECIFLDDVVFDGSTVHSLRMPGSSVPRLDATNLRVRGNLELNEGFASRGTVSLLGARVEGDLRLSEAELGTPTEHTSDSPAMLASRLRVSGALLASGLVAFGQIRLISAKIDGLLSLRGAALVHPNGIALQAERIHVGESVLLDKGFRADGRVFFQNGRIDGGFDAHEAAFAGGTEDKPALQLVRATVGRNLSLSGATVRGGVGIRSATVGGEVVLRRTTFAHPHGTTTDDEEQPRAGSVDGRHLTAAALDLRCNAPPSTVDLRHAALGLIRDAATSWPDALILQGCTYDSLEPGDSIDVPMRLRWLALDPHYRPQPYDQLRASYLATGDEHSARRVALAKQRARRATLSRAGTMLGYFQDATVGYGYRPGLAAAWVTVLALIGTITFWISPPEPIAGAPELSPLVYAIDVLLPVVDLGQADAFTPIGWTRWVAWGLVLAGWVLTTAVIAGLTRLLARP